MIDYSRLVAQFLKARAKGAGVSQSQLAEKLGVSLPTIKRWLNGASLTIGDLQRLAALLDISLSEIFSSLEELPEPGFAYTEAQERFFIKNLDCLAFFDNLLRGFSATQIQKKYKIQQTELVRYLADLERNKLIEWLPKNRVRLLVTGEVVWKKDGLLAARLRKEIFSQFLSAEKSSTSRFFLHDYLDSDRIEIERKIVDLIETAKKANRRSRLGVEHSKAVGLYISIQDFRWNLDRLLMNK